MKVGETCYLKCKHENKITPHRFEGQMYSHLPKDAPKKFVDMIKDKQLFTCKDCLHTFVYKPEEVKEPETSETI